jgi:hypothetical protein
MIFLRYIDFAMYLDLVYTPKHIAKTTYLEKVKTSSNLEWREYIRSHAATSAQRFLITHA